MGVAAGGALGGAQGAAIGGTVGELVGNARARKKAENAAKKSREKARRAAAKKRKGGLFHRAKNTYKKADKRFMAAQENVTAAIGSTARVFDHHAHPALMAFVALVFHFWDAVNGFNRGGNHALLMITVYALFALYAALFYYRTGLTADSLKYFGISIVALALPLMFLMPFIGPFLASFPVLLTIVTFTPIWFLYLGLTDEEGTLLHTLAKWWTYAIVIFLFIIALGMVTLPNSLNSLNSVQLGQSLRTTKTQFLDSWEIVKERMGGIFNIREWRARINQTFNPYAAYYRGEVEKNTHEPNGVYITNLESLYPHTYLGTEPIIQGRIEAKTFLEQGVRITPSCRLERNGKEGWMGTPDVTEPLDVNYKLVRDVLCTFPADANMKPGTYTATMGASFDFETWAYITNTFVSRALFQQYYAQDEDINKALDIDRNTQAVYTNGPVSVGVSASEQPIDINPEAKRPIQQRFGFTIANRWAQGEIQEVYNVQVIIPYPFKLEQCYPAAPATTAEKQRTTIYTFEKGVKADPRYDYRTITCQLTLPNKQAAQEVLAFGEKTPVEFVIIARYRYQIEKTTRVRIEE